MNLREAAEDVLRCFDEMADTETKGAAIRVRSYMLAIDALRAALAEPEAEPVAWMESPYGAIRANPLYKISAPQSVEWSIPLYAALTEPDEVAVAVAAEREACSKVCEQYAEHQQQWRNEAAEFRAMGANEAAEAIRARGAYEAETL